MDSIYQDAEYIKSFTCVLYACNYNICISYTCTIYTKSNILTCTTTKTNGSIGILTNSLILHSGTLQKNKYIVWCYVPGNRQFVIVSMNLYHCTLIRFDHKHTCIQVQVKIINKMHILISMEKNVGESCSCMLLGFFVLYSIFFKFCVCGGKGERVKESVVLTLLACQLIVPWRCMIHVIDVGVKIFW